MGQVLTSSSLVEVSVEDPRIALAYRDRRVTLRLPLSNPEGSVGRQQGRLVGTRRVWKGSKSLNAIVDWMILVDPGMSGPTGAFF